MKHIIPVLVLCMVLMCAMLSSCGEHVHTPVTEVEAVAVGCLTDGNTARVVCSGCGEVLEEQTTLPATGHKWVLEEIYLDPNEDLSFPGSFCCDYCGTYEDRTVTWKDLGLPVIEMNDKDKSITGDMKSKSDEIVVSFKYSSEELNYECDASIKWQGSTAATLPKKNYTVKLLETGTSDKKKVEMVEGWGKESKYCLKANYIDPSQGRNVVSAQLYGQVLKSQGEDLKAELQKLINAGAVDGFPAVMVVNGQFWGLYTFNIPKDKWLFGMKDAKNAESAKQALLMADAWSDSIQLAETIPSDGKGGYDYTVAGWELEYCNSEEVAEVGTNWVAESMNNLITFIKDNEDDAAAFKAGIGQYLDVDIAIDQMIYSFLFNGLDNSSKNIIWATYDGTLWFPSCYDMDGTWGMNWNGGIDATAVTMTPETIMAKNYFWGVLYSMYTEEVIARYNALRQNVLSFNNISSVFHAFYDQIMPELYTRDVEMWYNQSVLDSLEGENAAVAQDIAEGLAVNNLAQMLEYAEARLTNLDTWFAAEAAK